MRRLPPKNALKNTKRCAYCHKLQRADAQVCSLCGKSFLAKKTPAVTKDTHKKVSTPSMPSVPSVPPASTYRAGHYAGFHPEDQPYESSMIAVQRPTEVEPGPRNGVLPEPERIILPSTSEALVVKRRRERELEQQKRAQRLAQMRAQVRFPARVRFPVVRSGRSFFSTRVISLGLTLSCIVFLLAASIIAFVLIGRHRTEATAIVRATPGSVRVGDTFTLMGSGFTPGDVMTFTYDIHSPILNEDGQPLSIHINRLGGFSIQIPVIDHWSVGTHTIDALDTTAGMDASTQLTVLASSLAPPVLQLAQTRLQFPDASAGVVSSQFVVLTNAGGSKLVWHGQSDQPWLTLTPNSDTFAGAERVQVTVNRGGLGAKTYTGHIVFEQQDGHVTPSILTIQMVVKPTQSALAISTTALTYVTRSPRNTADQFIMLSNDSKSALNWASSVSINENAPWIELTPAYGRLQPGERKAIAVRVLSQNLTPGLYEGTINFTGGADAQVRVDLKVLAAARTVTGEPAAGIVGNSGSVPQPLPLPARVGVTPTPLPAQPASLPAISVSTAVIHFATTQGQNPAPQNVTLANTGNATLTWNATIGGSSSFAITPTYGSLAAGASIPLTISANVDAADPGALAATITINGGPSLPAQKISADVTIHNAQPTLSVSPGTITCSSASASQQLSITNNGTGTGHWGLQQASASTDTSWLSFSSGSGEVAPGASATITIHCDGSGLDTGTYTATLDVSDSDAGEVIKAIPITFAVS